MKHLFVMKHIIVCLVLTTTSINIAQPREQKPQEQQKSSTQSPPQELTTCITNLQQTGQLTPAKQEPTNKDDDTNKKNENEEKKFTDAASGIFAGVLTVISGASAKDPILIATGIFNVLKAAFLATTRDKPRTDKDDTDHNDEEVVTIRKRSRRTMRMLSGQELKELVARYQQQTNFKKRAS